MKTTTKNKSGSPAKAHRGHGDTRAIVATDVSTNGWLHEQLVRFDRMFAAKAPNQSFGNYIFSELAIAVNASSAVLAVVDTDSAENKLHVVAIHGDATEQLSNADEQQFRNCFSSGKLSSNGAEPTGGEQLVLPIARKGGPKAAMMFSASRPFNEAERELLAHAGGQFGPVLQSMEADARTQRLLRQSESLTRELQNQQVWLKHTNDELEGKARQLAIQKIEMETRNREIEVARQALQDQAEQLALTSKYKSEFLANMSHELRTPLNSMLLLARQLMDNREKTLTAKQLEFSKVIHSAGQELLHLVNDILDLAKIEAGKISVEIADYATADFPEFVERNFQLLAQSKNLALDVELAPNLPPVVQTDARRLEQILKNLLSNALKFTKEGSVKLRAERAQGGWRPENNVLNQAPVVVAISVVDTGIGIPLEKQKLIFEAFQQADGSTSREFGGTGLGLTISRELAALLGGEIELKSTPGQGSTFTLYIPQTTVAPAAPSHGLRERVVGRVSLEQLASDPSTIRKLRGRTALVVDDDIRNIFALTSLLERFGMKVHSAEEGKTALDLLNSNGQIDVVLMDIMMPGLDGFSVIHHLRQSDRFRGLPIIAVTAKAMKGDREKCLRAGASEYIAKPLNPETLLDALIKSLP